MIECAICGYTKNVFKVDSNDCLRTGYGEYICVKCCRECPFNPSVCAHIYVKEVP